MIQRMKAKSSFSKEGPTDTQPLQNSHKSNKKKKHTEKETGEKLLHGTKHCCFSGKVFHQETCTCMHTCTSYLIL